MSNDVTFLIAYTAALAVALLVYWRIEVWRIRKHAKALHDDFIRRYGSADD